MSSNAARARRQGARPGPGAPQHPRPARLAARGHQGAQAPRPAAAPTPPAALRRLGYASARPRPCKRRPPMLQAKRRPRARAGATDGRRRRGAQVAVTDAPVRRGVLLLRAENVAVLGGQARPALPPASGARRASPACQLQPPPGKQLRARRSQHLFHVVAADCGSKTHQRAPACSAGAYAPVRAPEPSPSQSAAAPAPGRAPGGRAAARAGALAAAAGRAQRARARGRRARPVRGGGRGGLGCARAARPARGVPRSRRSERSMVRLGASRMPGFLRALTHHAWLVSGVPLQCAHLSGPSACAAHQRTSLA